MEDFNILNTLNSMKEQIYLDFNTNNKIENQNLLNTSDNYLKIIEQQKITINNLKEQINLKEECAQILEENNNFILNNFNI